MTKIDMVTCWASTQTTPSVVATAKPPPMSGSAAATTLPKTSSSTSRANGSAYDSALRRSLAESVSMSA